MSALVSVIVPTYNRPLLLQRALKSIERQTFKDYEVIVVNDGGESMGDMVECYSQPIYLEHAQNRGISAARNTGLSHAEGVYIAYLDDDDQYYPFHLEVLSGCLQAGARFAYSDADVQYPHKSSSLWFSRDFSRKEILERNVAATCCIMHERALIDEVGTFDENLPNHEDWDLWIRMSKVTDFHHLHRSTALIDRTIRVMSANAKIREQGKETVYNRYHGRKAC